MNDSIPLSLERLYAWIAKRDKDLYDQLDLKSNHNKTLADIAKWYNLPFPNPMKPMAYRAEKLLLSIQRQWDDGK